MKFIQFKARLLPVNYKNEAGYIEVHARYRDHSFAIDHIVSVGETGRNEESVITTIAGDTFYVNNSLTQVLDAIKKAAAV